MCWCIALSCVPQTNTKTLMPKLIQQIDDSVRIPFLIKEKWQILYLNIFVYCQMYLGDCTWKQHDIKNIKIKTMVSHKCFSIPRSPQKPFYYNSNVISSRIQKIFPGKGKGSVKGYCTVSSRHNWTPKQTQKTDPWSALCLLMVCFLKFASALSLL